MSTGNEPRAYDLSDPSERARLLREIEGYLKTSAFYHEGTDREGRIHAACGLRQALREGFILARPQDPPA